MHNYFEHFGTSGTRSPWYPFSTPDNIGGSGGDEIDVFQNNIVVYPGDVSPGLPQSAGSPGTVAGNAYVGPTAETSIQGPGGIHAGTAKADLDLNPDFTPQAGSPVLGIGQPLPAGPVDPITTPGANDDAGPFPGGFSPGENWPRPKALTFKTDVLPDRWTSPGSAP